MGHHIVPEAHIICALGDGLSLSPALNTCNQVAGLRFQIPRVTNLISILLLVHHALCITWVLHYFNINSRGQPPIERQGHANRLIAPGPRREVNDLPASLSVGIALS